MIDIIKTIGAILLIIFIFWLLPGCVTITIQIDQGKVLNESILPYENDMFEDDQLNTEI
jgi:hypothetical protein